MKLVNIVRAAAIATVISSIVVLPTVKNVFFADLIKFERAEAIQQCQEDGMDYECDSL